MATGDARHISLSMIRNAGPEIESAFRSLAEWFMETVDELNDRIDRLTGAEGYIPKFDSDGGLADSEKVPPSGEIVGDTDEQTMTNKTLTSPSVTTPTITEPIMSGGTLTSPTIVTATMSDTDFVSTDGAFDFEVSAEDTDAVFTVTGTTNSGELKWMEDEDYFESSDDILMATDEALYFRDTDIYIASLDDGHLDIEADTSVDVNTDLVVTGDLSVSGDLSVTGAGGSGSCYTATIDASGITADTYMDIQGITMNGARGWVMPRAGSIVGVSLNLYCAAMTTAGILYVQVRKNGTSVYSVANTIDSASSYFNFYDTQDSGTDTFVAGDDLEIYLMWDTFVGSINYPIATIEVRFDT